MSRSVLQCWVQELSLMQQAVLLASIRGPDGIHKNHVSKKLLRWLRRSTLLAAFGGYVLKYPYDLGRPEGGSFTGSSISNCFIAASNVQQFYHDDRGFSRLTWQEAMDDVVDDYLQCVDELPHHFQLHFMHAAEILGYKHPEQDIRDWWHKCYLRLVNDAHLYPESEMAMDRRLGDSEDQWREAEEVTAR